MTQKYSPPIPKSIGSYPILSSLGKGGMGEVFLAKDPVVDRKIAIKRIRPELVQNPTIQSRFLREAHVASVLSHPSIVPILAIHSIPPLARIFMQICEAVAYTHSKGILHRDLKPENIMIGKFGEVMILDWGIADFIDHISCEEPLIESKISGK